MGKYLIIICGPTASGKTALAIQLATVFNTEIISADSRQFVKELNIGTAKPTSEQLELVVHHFINTHSITDQYSAGQFGYDARGIAESIFESKNVAIVCGGSGLYIDAMVHGFTSKASNDIQLRERLNNLFETKGLLELQKKAFSIDPEINDKIDINNSRRIIRHLEKLNNSELASNSNWLISKNIQPIWIGINTSREKLYNQINARVDTMMGQGLLNEAKTYHKYKNLPFLQTVGYKELFDFIEGKYSLDFAIQKIKQHTRNYAKRQITWFKRNNDIEWFDYDQEKEIISYIHSYINSNTNEKS